MTLNIIKETKHSLQTVDTISARELHEKLEVKKDFSDWIKAQIKRGLFNENIDFIVIWSNPLKGVAFLSETELVKKFGNTHRARALGWQLDYILIIEVAKHIAMMSGTAKGKEVRNYFIELEKQYKEPRRTQKEIDTNIAKIKAETKILEEQANTIRMEQLEVLKRLGVNIDPLSLVNNSNYKQLLPQNISEALTSVVSDIRANARTYSATYLLKQYGVDIQTVLFNEYLTEIEIAESYIHKEKRYKKFTSDINYYGHNQPASSTSKYPVTMLYYEDRFGELLTLMRNKGYEL
jgi:phage anti-repressor protein